MKTGERGKKRLLNTKGVALSAFLRLRSSSWREGGSNQSPHTHRLRAPCEGHVPNKRRREREEETGGDGKHPGGEDGERAVIFGSRLLLQVIWEGPFAGSPPRMTLQSAEKSKPHPTPTQQGLRDFFFPSLFFLPVTDLKKKEKGGETKAACQLHSDALRCTPAQIFVTLLF